MHVLIENSSGLRNKKIMNIIATSKEKYLNWIREYHGIEIGQIFDSRIEISGTNFFKDRPLEVFMFTDLFYHHNWYLSFMCLKTGHKRNILVYYDLDINKIFDVGDVYGDEDYYVGKIWRKLYYTGIPLTNGKFLPANRWRTKEYFLGGILKTHVTHTPRGLSYVTNEYQDILDKNALYNTFERETRYYRRVG